MGDVVAGLGSTLEQLEGILRGLAPDREAADAVQLAVTPPPTVQLEVPVSAFSALEVLRVGSELTAGAANQSAVQIAEERWRCRQLFMAVDAEADGTAQRAMLLALLVRCAEELDTTPHEQRGLPPPAGAARFRGLLAALHASVTAGGSAGTCSALRPSIHFEEYAKYVRRLHRAPLSSSPTETANVDGSGGGDEAGALQLVPAAYAMADALASRGKSAVQLELEAAVLERDALLEGAVASALRAPTARNVREGRVLLKGLLRLGTRRRGAAAAHREAVLHNTMQALSRRSAEGWSSPRRPTRGSAMVSDAVVTVPAPTKQLFDVAALRRVFGVYCEGGGRHGEQQWMSAAKFARLVREAGLVRTMPNADRGSLHGGTKRGGGNDLGLRKAELDLIFSNTLRLAKLGRLGGLAAYGLGEAEAGGGGTALISGNMIGFGAFVAALRVIGARILHPRHCSYRFNCFRRVSVLLLLLLLLAA